MDFKSCPVGLEIFRAEVGSTLHGTGLPGGEDLDQMGVTIEPPEHVVGLSKFEQFIFRTQPEGVRSGPGDLDLTVYSLRKFMRLATQGNPSIIVGLFAPPEKQVIMTKLGREMLALIPAITCRNHGRRFLGYMRAQRERLEGVRGGKHTNRPELIETFGFDTKYAMHMVRLGVQGVEYLETGRLTLPVPEPWGDWLRALRRGDHTEKEALSACDELEDRLLDLIDGESPLQPEPNVRVINRALVRMYTVGWRHLSPDAR